MVAAKRGNRQHERFGVPRTVTHTIGFTVGPCAYGTYKHTYKYASVGYDTLLRLKFRRLRSPRIRNNIADIRHTGNIEEQPVKSETEA